MKEFLKQTRNTGRNVGQFLKSGVSKSVAGISALGMSAVALAGGGGGSSPGAAIAGELAGGGDEVMLVISAVAVILGILLLWSLVKRAR